MNGGSTNLRLCIGYNISIILVCICHAVLFNRVISEMFYFFSAVLVDWCFDFDPIYTCSMFSTMYTVKQLYENHNIASDLCRYWYRRVDNNNMKICNVHIVKQ